MHFLRFGSNIPGQYWGCCAIDIIQDFNHNPDAKQSIQLVDGDSGTPLMRDKECLFAGMTYREIFETRLRIGTFSTDDMPNHVFIASLTDEQIAGTNGKKWLKILKESGFEFLRTVANSVYTGANLDDGNRDPGEGVHLFAMFRNIGQGAIKDPFTPPKAWSDLPSVMPETFDHIREEAELAARQTEFYTAYWRTGETKLYRESEVVAAKGVPVIYAGKCGIKAGTKTNQIENAGALKAAIDNLLKPKAAPAASPFPNIIPAAHTG